MKKFEEYTNWYDIDDKLKLLKSYIHILGDKEKYNLQTKYFIILYNFLIIERQFIEKIKLADKEINKHLELERLNSVQEVLDKFTELYDRYHPVRNNVETLDNIDSVGNYLSQRPEIYKKLIKK